MPITYKQQMFDYSCQISSLLRSQIKYPIGWLSLSKSAEQEIKPAQGSSTGSDTEDKDFENSQCMRGAEDLAILYKAVIAN